MDRETLWKKIIYVVIYYGFYCNGIFLLLFPKIFEDFFFLVYLLILYIGGIIDTFLRPIETESKEEGNFFVYILVLLLLSPFLFILAIVENEWLFSERITIISWIGLMMYATAAVLVIIARVQLGKQATAYLALVKNHELVQSGIYRHIRHPMYSATLVGILGFGLVTQSIIVTIVTFVLYFKIFNDRATREEKILKDAFGEAYERYLHQTKRYIPYLF